MINDPIGKPIEYETLNIGKATSVLGTVEESRKPGTDAHGHKYIGLDHKGDLASVGKSNLNKNKLTFSELTEYVKTILVDPKITPDQRKSITENFENIRNRFWEKEPPGTITYIFNAAIKFFQTRDADAVINASKKVIEQDEKNKKLEKNVNATLGKLNEFTEKKKLKIWP